MLPLFFAATYVVAVCAESPSIVSYATSQGGSMRDYEYSGRTGESSFMGAKPSYSDFGGSYVTINSSPYPKSDTRYSSDSNSESSESQASLTVGSIGGNSGSSSGSSFYKSKYANEAAVNAIRPSSATSEELSSAQAQSSGYTSSGSQSSNYYGSPYGERGLEHQQHGAYSTTGESTGHPEYSSMQGRPSSGSLYPGYVAHSQQGEYLHTKPSSYSHGGLPTITSQTASEIGAEYQTGSRHQVHASYPVSDEPYHGHAMAPQSPAVVHPYKSYIMSNPQSSYSSSKYQTVLGAIKSLFGGGNAEAAPSPSHPPTYLSVSASPSYFSPMHSASHHAPAVMTPSGYYFSSGSSASNSPYPTAYAKNYPPMRLMSSYGGNSGTPGMAGIGSGGKIVVVRDSAAAHGVSYPSTAAGTLLGSAHSSYASKNKIYPFASSPTGTGPSYISAAPSSMAYTPGVASSPYSGSYPSSSNFATARGGSTFLGYSAN